MIQCDSTAAITSYIADKIYVKFSKNEWSKIYSGCCNNFKTKATVEFNEDYILKVKNAPAQTKLCGIGPFVGGNGTMQRVNFSWQGESSLINTCASPIEYEIDGKGNGTCSWDTKWYKPSSTLAACPNGEHYVCECISNNTPLDKGSSKISITGGEETPLIKIEIIRDIETEETYVIWNLPFTIFYGAQRVYDINGQTPRKIGLINSNFNIKNNIKVFIFGKSAETSNFGVNYFYFDPDQFAIESQDYGFEDPLPGTIIDIGSYSLDFLSFNLKVNIDLISSAIPNFS